MAGLRAILLPGDGGGDVLQNGGVGSGGSDPAGYEFEDSGLAGVDDAGDCLLPTERSTELESPRLLRLSYAAERSVPAQAPSVWKPEVAAGDTSPWGRDLPAPALAAIDVLTE